MACIINLLPDGGDANGNWYLTTAPGGYDGNMETRVTGGSFAPNNPVLAADGTVIVAAQDGGGNDVEVNIAGEAVGTYIFTYVTPDPNDASNCADDCVDCETYTITAEDIEPDGSGSFCDDDGATYNVFTEQGVSNLDYTITGVTGCTLGNPDCVAANGDFVPSDMGAGSYVVTLERVGALDSCDDCDVEFTINISAAGNAGDPQSGVVCL